MRVRQVIANPSSEEERMQLRRDLAAIMQINSQYAQKTTPEHIQTFSNSGVGICLVAEDKSSIIGFLLLALTPSGAAIIDVETSTEHLGSGVTQLLIEKAQELAFLKGVQHFYKIRV